MKTLYIIEWYDLSTTYRKRVFTGSRGNPSTAITTVSPYTKLTRAYQNEGSKGARMPALM
jgi:hypothetical protein